MKLFSNNIVPYASTEGDKIYPIVVDIKKGIKSGEAISFVTADNQVGVITVDFMDGNSSYSIEGCMVTSTIHRPDGTVLEIPCDIISQSTIEIPLGINGTYQEGTHTFDLKIVRGNGKIIGVPTMSYSVSGSLSSDDVVEGDDRLPVLTMVLDNAQDKLTRLDKAIAGVTNDLEVKEARDGEVTLNARLERDLAKGKIHFVDVEGSYISTESQEGYLENIEIHGNTWQDSENLADIRSVGTKVEGQELYEIPVLSCGKNLFDGQLEIGTINSSDGLNHSYAQEIRSKNYIRVKPLQDITVSYSSGPNISLRFYDENKKYLGSNIDFFGNGLINSGKTFTIPENTHYLRFKAITTDLTIKYQLEEGTQVTSYEPYKEDKLTILSPTPLEKVGDIADRIICKNGVWGVEKNIETKVLNGSEGWFMSTWVTSTTRTFEYLDMTINFKLNEVQVLSDKFVGMSRSSVSDITDTEYITTSGGLRIFINILKSKLPTENVAGLKSWLKTNPMLIKYQSTQPQFIPLPHDQQVKLRTFADRTNISFLTEIEGTIKAQVPKSLGATVNTHTTQIDNLNKELDKVKKLEESTVSTVTTNSSFNTVAETTNGYFEDVKIEGKTLVNLAGSVSDYFNQFAVVARTCMLLKGNTEYTAVISNKVDHLVRVYGNEGSILATPTFDIPAKTTIIKKLHTKDVVDDTGLFKSNSTTGTLFKLDILLLEGDHTDKDLNFFEGLKSVGQDNDEINVSSVSANLLNFIKLDESVSNRKRLIFEPIDMSVNIVNNINKIIVATIRENGSYKREVKIESNQSKYITLSNYEYIEQIELLYSNGFDNSYIFNEEDIYITCENSKSSYVSHKQDKKEILYYNPTTQTWEKPILREWDSIEKHDDGKYYYRKRSNEVKLDSSENWYLVSTKTNTIGFGVGVLTNGSTNLSKIISDKFAFVNSDEVAQIRLGNNGQSVFIFIDKTKLSTQDVAGFKQWLQANPVTVVYQLAEEEVYECTNLDLITYSGETNLIVNSGAIQPRITLKVLSNVSNVVKLLQEKVSILENKFIEGLKQVLSGDMLSLAQLLYPEDFEHEIQTLEL